MGPRDRGWSVTYFWKFKTPLRNFQISTGVLFEFNSQHTPSDSLWYTFWYCSCNFTQVYCFLAKYSEPILGCVSLEAVTIFKNFHTKKKWKKRIFHVIWWWLPLHTPWCDILGGAWGWSCFAHLLCGAKRAAAVTTAAAADVYIAKKHASLQ